MLAAIDDILEERPLEVESIPEHHVIRASEPRVDSCVEPTSRHNLTFTLSDGLDIEEVVRSLSHEARGDVAVVVLVVLGFRMVLCVHTTLETAGTFSQEAGRGFMAVEHECDEPMGAGDQRLVAAHRPIEPGKFLADRLRVELGGHSSQSVGAREFASVEVPTPDSYPMRLLERVEASEASEEHGKKREDDIERRDLRLGSRVGEIAKPAGQVKDLLCVLEDPRENDLPPGLDPLQFSKSFDLYLGKPSEQSLDRLLLIDPTTHRRNETLGNGDLDAATLAADDENEGLVPLAPGATATLATAELESSREVAVDEPVAGDGRVHTRSDVALLFGHRRTSDLGLHHAAPTCCLYRLTISRP